ncbi:flightin [Carabus blaptoides fortunei]
MVGSRSEDKKLYLRAEYKSKWQMTGYLRQRQMNLQRLQQRQHLLQTSMRRKHRRGDSCINRNPLYCTKIGNDRYFCNTHTCTTIDTITTMTSLTT